MPGEIYDVTLKVVAWPQLPCRDPESVSVSLEGSDGTKSHTMRFPIDDLLVIDSLAHGPNPINDKLRGSMGALLFAEDINSTLRTLLEEHQRLRLILDIDVDSSLSRVREIPWEAAYFADRAPKEISLHPKVSFVRRHPRGILQVDASPATRPLKVAYAVGPGLPDQQHFLKDMKAELQQRGQSVEALTFNSDPTTWDEFRKAAIASDIAQFSGHGAVIDNDTKAVGLMFADRHGHPDFIPPLRGQELEEGRLRVLLLSACQSGGGGSWHNYDSWADLNCPCIILMQSRVTNSAADAFTKAFYLELAVTGDLDEAIRQGRHAMHDAYRDDDCAIVVYSRYPRGATILRKLPTSTTDFLPGTSPAAGAVGPPRQRAADPSRDRRPIVRIVRVDPTHNLLESWLSDNHFWTIVGPSAREPRAVTPLLGPGTATVDPARGALRWDSSLESAVDPQTAVDPAFSRFVHKLVDDRWDKSRRRIPFTPSTEEERSISDIRLGLGQLACLATTEFAAAAIEATVPLTQWDNHKVEIPLSDPLLDQLDQLIDSLAKHNKRHGDADELFGGVFLESRLRSMHKELRTGPTGLTGSTIRWLTNLFWHAVIYDSPLYPSPGELEMQVSLFVNRDRPTRDFGASTSLIRYELEHLSEVAARALRRGFDLDEPDDSPGRRFYRSIGAVMHGQYAEWQARRRVSPKEQWPLPLVVTSNLDLELERALAATGHRFHVAVPVYFEPLPPVGTVERGEPDEHSTIVETIRWVVGTFSGDNPSSAIADLEKPLATWQWLDSLDTGREGTKRCDLEGPLLLKLNGSPLHRIPTGLGGTEPDDPVPADPALTDELSDLTDPHPFRVEHAIALGEFDFLQATRVNQWSFDREPGQLSADKLDGFPSWLVDEIRRDARYWLLLGFDLADWASRIQLHTSFTNVSRRTERGCAIAADFDEVRLRFLDWLGIVHARGDMAELTPSLERLAAERLAVGKADGLHVVGGRS